MKFLICNVSNIWPGAYEFRRVSVKSAMCHQVNASFKFRTDACNKWPSDCNNCPRRCGLLVHSIISSDVIWTVHVQIAPAAT
jgi:hypothetical protein